MSISTNGDGLPHEIEGVLWGHASVHRQLWGFVRGITEAEMDWRVHPQTNDVRWILSHLLAIEEWTADMLEDAESRRTNRDAKRYPRRTLEEIRHEDEVAFARTQTNLRMLRREDLARDVDMLGVMTVPLLPVLENHVHHIAGHMYQVRLIRGTHARVHGTDKKAFDPW